MAAVIKFALHGNSLVAYKHSGAGKVGYSYTPLNYPFPAASEADPSAIGGSRLTFDTAQSDIRGWVWPGFTNASLTGKYSILVRVKFPYAPPPLNNTFLFSVAGFAGLGGAQAAGVGLTLNADGTLRLHIWNYRTQQVYSNESLGAWAPAENVWYDVVLTWDGSQGANKVKCYVDGTVFGTKTAGANSADGNDNFMQASIGLGFPMVSGFRGDVLVNEFVLWDDEIDPTSAGFNLNGAARTSFVTVPAPLDPDLSVDPGADKVQLNTGYTINGVSVTGSLVVGTPPDVSDVRLGTTFIDNTGATLTGTLSIPATFSGTSSEVNYGQIKENIRYLLFRENTTTSSFDLSGGMNQRVNKIMTLNPGRIPVQKSWYPFVTTFVEKKDIKLETIAKNQATAKRSGDITLKIIGAVWNSKHTDLTKDAAQDDCELLMENVESILRQSPTLSDVCLWQRPSGVTYFNRELDEETSVRVGILSLDLKVDY